MLSSLALLAIAAGRPGHAATIQISPVKTLEGIHALALAPAPSGSRFVASLESDAVDIFDAGSKAIVRKLGSHPQPAMAVAWSHDGELIASGDESARIFEWNAETGAKLRTMQGHIRGIQDLSFNYPGTLLVSTGKDDALKVWDLETGKPRKTILGEGANFYSACFRGKTNDFGVGILGFGAREYDPTGQPRGFYTDKDGQGIFDIAFNSAGTRAVTAGRDGLAIIWDAATKQRLGSLHGHQDWVVHCAFSPNGQWIATSGDDRTVRIWSPYTFKQVAELDNEQAVGSPLCWTADGKYLITVDMSNDLQINAVTPPQAGSSTGGLKPPKRGRRRHGR